jgi:hypothetical protein
MKIFLPNIIVKEKDLAKYRCNEDDYDSKYGNTYNDDFVEILEYKGKENCLKSFDRQEVKQMPTGRVDISIEIISSDLESNQDLLLDILSSL